MMNWRVFFGLSGVALVTALPLIPVVVILGEAGLTADPRGWRLTAFAVLAGALLVYPAAVFCGLRIGGKLGLTAPLTEAWTAGRAPEDLTQRLATGLALGGGFGLAGVLIALNLGGAAGPAEAAGADIIPLWTGAAQAVSAGVGEEILFRFGLMSLIAWFAWKVLPDRRGGPSVFGMWFAVGGAGLAFASVHGGEGLGAMQAVRLLAGTGFGWLLWKHGLEAAMAGHIIYDMVLFYGIVLVL